MFSLQKIIHRNDSTETLCTERDGWCLPKTSDDLRDTMSLMIKQIIRSKRPGNSLWIEAKLLGEVGIIVVINVRLSVSTAGIHLASQPIKHGCNNPSCIAV